MNTLQVSEAAMEARARRAALRVGLKAEKSRWRLNSIDNYGGFRIIDPYRNQIVTSEKFQMSPEEVIAYCEVNKGFDPFRFRKS